MTFEWPDIFAWLVRTTIAGGVVTLIAYVVVNRLTSARAKLSAGRSLMIVALLVPVLSFCPTWWSIPSPTPSATNRPPRALAMIEVKSATMEAMPLPKPMTTEFVAQPDTGPVNDIAEFIPSPRRIDPIESEEPAPLRPDWTMPWGEIKSMVGWSALVVMLYLVVRLLVGSVALSRWRGNATALPAWIQRIATELSVGMPRAPLVGVCDQIRTPACFGWRTPTVLLPRALTVSATEAELRWVLAHEFDHLRRGDHRAAVLTGLVRAIYFAFPWIWGLSRDLELAQEYLADDAAARAGGTSADYADFLVRLSTPTTGSHRPLPPPATGVGAGRSDLYRRVTMLLRSDRPTERRLSRYWGVALTASTLAAAVLLSGISWADDEKPRTTEAKKADKAPEAKAPEKRTVIIIDGEKKVENEKKGDGDKGERKEIVAGRFVDLSEIKAKIEEAARKGDVEEVRKQIARLEKAMGQPMVKPEIIRPGTGGIAVLPPRVERPQAVVPSIIIQGDVDAGKLQEAFDRNMKAFEEAMDKLKDQPEAREQLKKAMDQYRQTMRENLNLHGKVIPGFGINGQGDTIPGVRVLEVAQAPKQPRFGASVASLTEALAEQLDLAPGSGLVVTGVVKDSVADKAGIRKNDVIVQFAGQDVRGEAARFQHVVDLVKPGEKIDVVIVRKGKKETLKGIELPAPAAVITARAVADKYRRVNFDSMSSQVKNGTFTVQGETGGVKYELQGKLAEGKPVPASIIITEEGKPSKVTSIDEVPEKHRDAVRTLLMSVSGR